MIYGIGTDIVKVERIEKAKESFFERIYTEREREELKENPQRLAGNFAAKEAVVKALGTGFREIAPIDIEILRNSEGKPYAVLNNSAEQYNFVTIHVSITHEKDYAAAFAVAERRDNN
ncbi:MAG: holo-ACP synthase [Clostridiales bacterium]|nr:holo-ACP synthase [Clostridiales bacterium]